MEPSDRGPFAEEITLLFAGRRAPEPTPIELKAYWQTLSDFPLDVVTAACRQARRQPGTFVPSEGDVWRASLAIAKERARKRDAAQLRALLAVPVAPWTDEQIADAKRLLMQRRLGASDTEMEWLEGNEPEEPEPAARFAVQVADRFVATQAGLL